MLESVKIARRQSEIRQLLADLLGKKKPSEEETRSMEELDTEYQSNEVRYRAALITEDEERREATAVLENRGEDEWRSLVSRFELRQVAQHLHEGAAIDGETAEVIAEMRNSGGYQGVPIPWGALEQRVGETVASGTPDPVSTRPIIDRLFPSSVAARMGGSMVAIDRGDVEYPVATSSVAAAWQADETADVAGPTAYTTVDRPLKPDHTLGVQMKLTRKSLLQSGAGLEAAVRRDMNGAMSQAMDAAVFLGTGAGGQPTGLFTGAAAWGITETAIDAAADYAAFRAAATRFMVANAVASLDGIRLGLRPELFDAMDANLITGTATSEWDRLKAKIGSVVMTSNAIAAPTGTPEASSAILTTSAGGVPPFFVGAWGGVDLIRDPYSDAASGALRLTALATLDVTISRAAQIEILTGLEG